MRSTPQITWQNLSPSDDIEANIREHIAKLEKFSDRIVDCRVTIEVPHRHHDRGNIYHVRIDLSVPRDELVVNRHSPEQQADEDLHVAVRAVFERAERQLKEYTQRQRGEIKTHNDKEGNEIGAN